MGNSGILGKRVSGFQTAGTAINTHVIKRGLLRKQKKGENQKAGRGCPTSFRFFLSFFLETPLPFSLKNSSFLNLIS